MLLGVTSGVLFFALFYVNIKLAGPARRDGVVPLRSKNPEVPGPEELDPLIRRLLLPVALVLGFLAAPQAAMHWESALLFFNGVPFGIDDPLMGKDIGFYIFRLPALEALYRWFLVALGLILVASAFVHLLYGGVQYSEDGLSVHPAAKVHLSRAAGVAAPGSERRLPARRLQAALLAHRGGVRRRLHGHTRAAAGVAGAGGGIGGGGRTRPGTDALVGAQVPSHRAGCPGRRSRRRDVRLPLLPAAVPRRAQRAGGRNPLHPAQYPLHAARLRPRPGWKPRSSRSTRC